MVSKMHIVSSVVFKASVSLQLFSPRFLRTWSLRLEMMWRWPAPSEALVPPPSPWRSSGGTPDTAETGRSNQLGQPIRKDSIYLFRCFYMNLF